VVNSDTDSSGKLSWDTGFLLMQQPCQLLHNSTIVYVNMAIIIDCTFNSSNENPRPALTRRLYLIVGHRTTGLSLSIGLGAMAAAFDKRAFLRRSLRPG